MANITDKIAAIRAAIFGKDVRESIASGIEAINTEVEDTTAKQNVIDLQEQTRINAEIIRQNNESTRIKLFNQNEIDRDDAFSISEHSRDLAETNRQNIFTTNENSRQTTFDNSELLRTSGENTRIANEYARQISFQSIEDRFDQMEHIDAISEVVDARGSELTLNARLTKMEGVSSTLVTDLDEITNNYNVYASNADTNGFYTIVDYKRADNTTYMHSVWSNTNANGFYQACTQTYYEADGITVKGIAKVFSATYDSNGKITSLVEVS